LQANQRTPTEHASCFALGVTTSRSTAQEASLLWTLEEISRLVSHSGNPAETLANIVGIPVDTVAMADPTSDVVALWPDRSAVAVVHARGARSRYPASRQLLQALRLCPFVSRCQPVLPPHHISTLYNLNRRAEAEFAAQGYTTIYDLRDGTGLNV
jgi:hypothetical protein